MNANELADRVEADKGAVRRLAIVIMFDETEADEVDEAKAIIVRALRAVPSLRTRRERKRAGCSH